jgi:hypothetical protein
MENTFQTSFIPKKPLVTSEDIGARPHPRVSILLFLSILLLASMLLSSAVLYVYKSSLIARVASLQESVTLAKESFEPQSIAELQLFDKRMNAAGQILASHTVLSPVFASLADLTIPQVQFTKLAIEPGINGKNFVMRMSGLARDYKSIALQAQVFNGAKGKYFKDVAFSNLVLQNGKQNKGYVGFDISFSVDPALVSYDKTIFTTNTPPR